MKEKKLNKALVIVCIFSFLFFVCSFLFRKDEKVSQKSYETSILNPKYKDLVKSIIFSCGDDTLRLLKYGELWVVEKGGLFALSDESVVISLLEKLSKIRSVYKISDGSERTGSYNSDLVSPFLVSFFDKDEKLISDVSFFSADSLTGRLTFSSSQTKTLYESEDDFFHMLNLDMNFWAAGSIFYGISDPVQISYRLPSVTGKLTESDGRFKTVSHELESLRHGQVSKRKLAPAEPVLEIIVQDGNGRAVRASVFSFDGDFFLSRTVQPSALFDSSENSFGFMLENVSYEISGWTFGRIKDALGISEKSVN